MSHCSLCDKGSLTGRDHWSCSDQARELRKRGFNTPDIARIIQGKFPCPTCNYPTGDGREHYSCAAARRQTERAENDQRESARRKQKQAALNELIADAGLGLGEALWRDVDAIKKMEI